MGLKPDPHPTIGGLNPDPHPTIVGLNPGPPGYGRYGAETGSASCHYKDETGSCWAPVNHILQTEQIYFPHIMLLIYNCKIS